MIAVWLVVLWPIVRSLLAGAAFGLLLAWAVWKWDTRPGPDPDDRPDDHFYRWRP